MSKVAFSQESLSEFERIVAQYPERRAAMLPTLYLAEKEFGHISPEVEVYVGELLQVPAIKVREVLTFYTLFASKPRGKLHFQVCRGISCDLRGCTKIIEHLQEKLNLNSEETSADLAYTLSEVECLGACETAPMMQLNDDYHGDLTTETVDLILDEKK